MVNEGPKLIHQYGIRYFIDGDMNDPYLKKLMLQARSDLQQMKIRNINNLDHLVFNRPEAYKIISNFGEDTIHIIVPGKEEKELAERILEFEKEDRKESITYCLLVEMRPNTDNFDVAPSGFAIFIPGSGHNPISEGGLNESMGIANMSFFGFTALMVENTLDPPGFDPPGIIGQATERLMWCKDHIGYQRSTGLPGDEKFTDLEFSRTIEQVKRVDQGFWAYPGAYDGEEVTACFPENNIWTYEGIAYPTRWFDVEPGPATEEFAGYSWAMWELYSPDGDDSADYHDIQYLFRGKLTVGLLNSWWPPLFHQYITRQQSWHINSIIYRYIDWDNSAWDAVWGGEGMDTALVDIMFPGGHAKATKILNDTIRVWGLVYGHSAALGLEDIVKEQAEFPYLDYDIREDHTTGEVITNYMRDYYQDGVYVKDRWREMFTIGLILWPPGDFYTGDLLYVNVRENRHDYPLEDLFTNPGNLTEDQLEILEGNVINDDIPLWYEGSQGDPEDSEERYYTEGIAIINKGWISINAGGDEFIIKKQEVVDTYVLNHIVNETKTRPKFTDYGIFTKKDTGITKDENDLDIVDYETIEPIYAYSARIRATDSLQSDVDDESIIYGMVLDGLHYRTEEFPVQLTELGWTGYYTARNFAVPGLDEAKAENIPIYCKEHVRIGMIITSTLEKERTIHEYKDY